MKKLLLLFIPLLFISCEPNANNDVTIEETVEKQEPAQEQNTEEQNTEINNTPKIKHYVITFDNGFSSSGLVVGEYNLANGLKFSTNVSMIKYNDDFEPPVYTLQPFGSYFEFSITIPENERVCEMKIYKIGLINPNAESEVVGEIRVSDGDFGGWEELKYTDNSYHYGFYSELSDFKVFYSGHVVEFYKIEIDTITK